MGLDRVTMARRHSWVGHVNGLTNFSRDGSRMALRNAMDKQDLVILGTWPANPKASEEEEKDGSG